MSGIVAVEFPCGALVLEGCLHHETAGTLRGAAVVCHPHPSYGGTMHNPVVVTLSESLASAGFTSLRFNFRQVSGSSGGPAEEGAAREDVAAALRWLASEVGSDVPMLVAGYSFGAWAGYPVACATPGVAGVLCVAPPLDLLPMAPSPSAPLTRWFALGDRDEYCSLDTFGVWYRGLAEPKRAEVLPGADHFLRGWEVALGATAEAFALSSTAQRKS